MASVWQASGIRRGKTALTVADESPRRGRDAGMEGRTPNPGTVAAGIPVAQPQVDPLRHAPMPWAMFHDGNSAIHGTDAVKRPGRPASHGCVRLHPEHARILFRMIQAGGMENARMTLFAGGRRCRGEGGCLRHRATVPSGPAKTTSPGQRPPPEGWTGRWRGNPATPPALQGGAYPAPSPPNPASPPFSTGDFAARGRGCIRGVRPCKAAPT